MDFLSKSIFIGMIVIKIFTENYFFYILYRAYEEVDGDYKKLRNVQVPDSSITWDIERNKNLQNVVDRVKEQKKWFQTDGEFEGLPTEGHIRCIMWAYSHDAGKLKKLLPTLAEKLKS